MAFDTLLSASSAAIINVLKEITNIPDDIYLLSPSMLEGIFKTKQNKQNFLKILVDIYKKYDIICIIVYYNGVKNV